MIIDLINKKPEILQFGNGDILVFCNGESYDYHKVVFDNHGCNFRLLSLEDSNINDKWSTLSGMVYDLNHTQKNNHKLIEVLKPNEVALSRVTNE